MHTHTHAHTHAHTHTHAHKHSLKRQSNKGFVGLSAGPLTPRSPTTTATPITVISAEDLDGPFSSQFKFDANSINSDDSDTTFPRYTYRVSPSPGDVSTVLENPSMMQIPVPFRNYLDKHETNIFIAKEKLSHPPPPPPPQAI